MNNDRTYKINLSEGEVYLTLPFKMTPEDCDDIEAHFALVVRQSRRRAEEGKVAL